MSFNENISQELRIRRYHLNGNFFTITVMKRSFSLHLHESVGDGREEGGGPGGGPQVVEGGVALQLQEGRSQAHRYQQELQPRVHLGDGGGLDGGGGECRVEVFLDGEGGHDAHVPDVQPGVHQEQVPGHDQAGEGGGDEVGVGEGEVGRPCRQTVRHEQYLISSYLRGFCRREDLGRSRGLRIGS